MKKIIFAAITLFPLLVSAQEVCGFRQSSSFLNISLERVTEDSTTVLRIPVVIHTLHLRNPVGTVNNPSELRIKEAIDYLNQVFRANWPGYPDTAHGGVDTKIEFVLANRDRNGRLFNGVDRIDASGFAEYVQYGRVDRELLVNTMWDKFRYFNIWIVHRIEGGTTGFGAAPEPIPHPLYENYEGFVIVGSSFKAGDPVMVHEAGHYFGLAHTWGGAFGNSCPTNNNCEVDNDGICDTEPHGEFASCERIGFINPCTGLPYGNTLKNFMSYSAPGCLDRFTHLQKKRMRLTTMELRPGIANNDLTKPFVATVHDLDGFNILPNPNSGNFKIQVLAPVSGVVTISIMGNNGQLVFRKETVMVSQRDIPVSVGRLNPGIYFVSLRDKKAVLTNTMIIR